MDTSLKTTIWQQFGAALDMLGNAISACPDELWDAQSQFWYNAYHTIFYLDYYLSDPENFMPPAPYTLSEFDGNGKLPDRVYTKKELTDYISYCKKNATFL